jgi:hypothetical protein
VIRPSTGLSAEAQSQLLNDRILDESAAIHVLKLNLSIQGSYDLVSEGKGNIARDTHFVIVNKTVSEKKSQNKILFCLSLYITSFARIGCAVVRYTLSSARYNILTASHNDSKFPD